MKVLMINSNNYKLPVPAMPFGLCCVSAAVEKAGHKVRFLDLMFSKHCKRDINKAVREFQPDIIGISIRNVDTAATNNTLFLLDQIRDEVIKPVKKIFRGPVVIGGSAVGISGKEMLSFFDLEYAIRGDGEVAMVEFIDRIEKKLPLKGLKGLIRRKENRDIENNPPHRPTDLDSFPAAQHHRYLDINMYRKFKSPIQVQAKRGCNLKCVYCTYNIIEGKKIRLKAPQLIADDIETTVKETGFNHIEFTDSTFNIPLPHAKAVLRAIAAKKLDLELQTMGLNPGAIDEEFAGLMKETNFKEVHVSVESGCNTTLRSLGKNFDKNDILQAAKHLHAVDIPVVWYVLTGAPGESERTLRETFATMTEAASSRDLVCVGNGIRLYKGSPLAKQTLQENPDCTQDNFLHPVAFQPKAIDLEKLRILNKQVGLNHPNFVFFEEFQRLPFIALKIQTSLMKLFAPGKPWWKSYIFFNNLQKVLGIGALKRLAFEIRNHKVLHPQPGWVPFPEQEKFNET